MEDEVGFKFFTNCKSWGLNDEIIGGLFTGLSPSCRHAAVFMATRPSARRTTRSRLMLYIRAYHNVIGGKARFHSEGGSYDLSTLGMK